MLEPELGKLQPRSAATRSWRTKMSRAAPLGIMLSVLWAACLRAEPLPDDWRQSYSDEDGVQVIETAQEILRWRPGDWDGMTLQAKGDPGARPVVLHEDGPAPDTLVRFDTGLELCGRSLSVATLVYAPSYLREQSAYAWLRVLFDPQAPAQSWQIWDEAAQRLAFGYDARDLLRLYEVDCETMEFSARGIPMAP